MDRRKGSRVPRSDVGVRDRSGTSAEELRECIEPRKEWRTRRGGRGVEDLYPLIVDDRSEERFS